jgi:cell division protease FtsH
MKVNKYFKNLMAWVVVLIALILMYRFSLSQTTMEKDLTFSEFLDKVEKKEVTSVVITGNKLSGKLKNDTNFKTVAPEYSRMIDILRKYRVKITAEEDSGGGFLTILVSLAPFVFIVLIWVLIMRQMQGGSNKALSFGKSRAKMFTSMHNRITFDDVAGLDEVEEELQEIIEFLKEPQKFRKLGGRIPKGVLLMGPPGAGKTLLGRAIAGEANVPFFYISGSDFVEMFVGVGASRVRDLFNQGKKNAPCIIFIDEIDAVGRHRGAGLGGGHDEREQTLNQLLVELDGFESNEGVIILAATNRPDVLDPALMRPGRFDRRIVIHNPDVAGREGILKIHTRKIPMGESVNLSLISRGTPGFSGADLENLVNEAALIAARQNKKKVEMEDFENAKDKVLMGVARKSMIINDKEKELTAYHEAGHALCSALLEHTDPVYKATVIPRGMALGVTQTLPVDDKHNYDKKYLEDQIVFMLGGRVAEEIMLKATTTGAGNDFERVTEIARRMVTDWGMSEKLGPLTFGKKEESIFLGKELGMAKEISEKTAILIDEEITKIVKRNYKRAVDIITKNKKALKSIAEALLKYESLDAEDIKALIEGKEIKKRISPEKASRKELARKSPGRRKQTVQPVTKNIEDTTPA